MEPFYSRRARPLLRGAARKICLVGLALLLAGAESRGEDKKEEKKKDPPSVTVVLPLGIVRGRTNTALVRGLNLTNATSVALQDTNLPVRISIVSRKKVDVPSQQEAKKAGDTQIELSVEASAALPLQPVMFRVANPDGWSPPHTLPVFDPVGYVEEKEPNGGFKTAQKIAARTVVAGSIQQPNDVDVFRIEGEAGKKLVAEIKANAFGSALDPILSLYDGEGHLLATEDDSAGSRDPLLKATFPESGVYYLAVTDAHDQGSVTHAYYLEVGGEPGRGENLVSKPAAPVKMTGMRPKIVTPKNSPKPVGPYSHAVRVGDLLFCSGQIPIVPATGDLVAGDIKAETAQVLENVRAILDQEGLSFRDVVKSTVYLLNLGDFAAMNEVYGRYFTADFPARSTVQVSGLPRGAKVEIEVVAHYSTP